MPDLPSSHIKLVVIAPTHGGMARPSLLAWLVTYRVSLPTQKTVTYPGINRTQHRITTSVETNVLPLSQSVTAVCTESSSIEETVSFIFQKKKNKIESKRYRNIVVIALCTSEKTYLDGQRIQVIQHDVIRFRQQKRFTLQQTKCTCAILQQISKCKLRCLLVVVVVSDVSDVKVMSSTVALIFAVN